MTADLVSALIPPKISQDMRARVTARSRRAARITPAQLPPARQRCSIYGVAAVDDRGKVWADNILRTLQWDASTRLTLAERAGLLVLTAEEQGSFRLTSTGHLRIYTPVRHWYGLVAGSRVLLMADSDEHRLVIFPPAAIDAMVAAVHDSVLAGGA